MVTNTIPSYAKSTWAYSPDAAGSVHDLQIAVSNMVSLDWFNHPFCTSAQDDLQTCLSRKLCFRDNVWNSSCQFVRSPVQSPVIHLDIAGDTSTFAEAAFCDPSDATDMTEFLFMQPALHHGIPQLPLGWTTLLQDQQPILANNVGLEGPAPPTIWLVTSLHGGMRAAGSGDPDEPGEPDTSGLILESRENHTSSSSSAMMLPGARSGLAPSGLAQEHQALQPNLIVCSHH